MRYTKARVISWPPTLYPIVGLPLLLAGVVLLRGRGWPIAAFCLSLTAWGLAVVEGRWLMVGFFIPATLSHVVQREIGGRASWVGASYALAVGMVLTSWLFPDLYLTDGGAGMGKLFVPMFALTCFTGAVPLWMLQTAAPVEGRRETRRYLILVGVATSIGGVLHILLSLSGSTYPVGLYLVLSAIGLMSYVGLAADLPSFSRFAERSQRYTFFAALLSTVWMLALVSVSAGPGWTWESALLLFLFTFTAQPLLTEARSALTWVVIPGGDADGLSRALAHSESRAEHAERLAEIGRLASGVAHEVRNPLGVISACVSLLERSGADASVLEEIRAAVARANAFSADLLDYGRPSPLRCHMVPMESIAQVAGNQALFEQPHVVFSVTGAAEVEADAAQITQVLVILIENACWAGAHKIVVSIVPQAEVVELWVEDDGPGVAEPLVDSLFDAFVTGRGRDSPHPGTGLGLAIARGVADRHGGSLRYTNDSSLGGAKFVLSLPTHQGAP